MRRLLSIVVLSCLPILAFAEEHQCPKMVMSSDGEMIRLNTVDRVSLSSDKPDTEVYVYQMEDVIHYSRFSFHTLKQKDAFLQLMSDCNTTGNRKTDDNSGFTAGFITGLILG